MHLADRVSALARRRAHTWRVTAAARRARSTGGRGSVLVLGPPRSGTTWLLELLTQRGGLAVFEPCRPRPRRSPIPVRPDRGEGLPDGFRAVAADHVDDDLRNLVGAALAGRGLTDWSACLASPRSARRGPVVVKEIRLNRAAGWLAATFPTTSTMLLLRHPAETTRSMLEMGNASWQHWDAGQVRRLCAGAIGSAELDAALATGPPRSAALATFVVTQHLELLGQRRPTDSILLTHEELVRHGLPIDLPPVLHSATRDRDGSVGASTPSALASDERRAGRSPAASSTLYDQVAAISALLGYDGYHPDRAEPDRERLDTLHARRSARGAG